VLAIPRDRSSNRWLGSIQRRMSLSELTLGKIVQRFFLYIGIALAVLVICAVAIVLSKGAKVSGGWTALAVYTAGLFWVTIRQSRGYWNRPGFWAAISGLLVVHLLTFVAILRAYPQWRGIWFWPVVIVEGGLFGAILYLLFGERKHP
jgi:hypothetical protein